MSGSSRISISLSVFGICSVVIAALMLLSLFGKKNTTQKSQTNLVISPVEKINVAETSKELKDWPWGAPEPKVKSVSRPGTSITKTKPKPTTSRIHPQSLFRFVGVFVCSDPTFSEAAVINIKNKQEKMLKIGETYNGLKISEIGDTIKVSYQGKFYRIAFKTTIGNNNIQRLGNSWVVEKEKKTEVVVVAQKKSLYYATDTASETYWRKWQNDTKSRLGDFEPSLKYRDIIGEGRNILADFLLDLSNKVRG